MCVVNVWYVLCNILHICHPRVFYDQVQSYYLSIQQIFVSVIVISHFPSTTIYQDLLQKYQVSYKKYILLVHRKQMGSQPTLFRWGLCCLSFKFSVGFFCCFFVWWGLCCLSFKISVGFFLVFFWFCVQCCRQCLWIVHSWFLCWFTLALTFSKCLFLGSGDGYLSSISAILQLFPWLPNLLGRKTCHL